MVLLYGAGTPNQQLQANPLYRQMKIGSALGELVRIKTSVTHHLVTPASVISVVPCISGTRSEMKLGAKVRFRNWSLEKGTISNAPL